MSRKKRGLGYKARNECLRRNGWATYKEYLASDLWKEIRSRVLERDNSLCQACGDAATQVHHLSYGDVTIRGERIDKLISICNGCHRWIEFAGPHKRPFSKTKSALKRRRRRVRRSRERVDIRKQI